MIRNHFVAPLLATALIALAAAPAATADDALTGPQKKAVEQVVRDYLLDHPEVIVEALKAMETKHEAAQAARRQEALAALGDTLTANPDSPMLGNPDGDVTVVEFFDYNCGYCKRVVPDILALLDDDGGVRYVLKELPILSESSVIASRAALAVWSLAPDRYQDLHTRMMGLRGQLDEQRIMALVADLGLDVDRVKAAMESPEVNRELSRNRQMSKILGIRGTPAFVVGDRLIPGAVNRQQLEALVARAREGGS